MAEDTKEIQNETQKPLTLEEANKLSESMAKYNETMDKTKRKLADKIMAQSKNLPTILANASGGIIRTERKKLKKQNIVYETNGIINIEDEDTFLDFMLESRGISDDEADKIEVADLYVWVQLIVGRTLNKELYEGN